ncbi:hypothetical protein AB4455_06420 [Vibrio sp. 10N.261.46.E12]|nr:MULTISPECIES: hypothetical protein [unclassified Vibrio]PMN79285.1 hypothetical protein BCT22_17875 [Vibrio sp. 10N.261.45.A1]OMO37207.1 hypothetical protein BH584_23865 [Vibrio sp. 10N.261.45.E1]PMJ25760.1 hypothetical protein BCU27_09870 [Vibrio sp. 10N.286.45.B6]PML84445.1 hypothetical protein BCT66_17520 [Vibrio sp. 10N.261.49.E11]PMM90167.1 hypothetical protein BCT46_23665 [Vibrio sp. 10N.261.46.E8]
MPTLVKAIAGLNCQTNGIQLFYQDVYMPSSSQAVGLLMGALNITDFEIDCISCTEEDMLVVRINSGEYTGLYDVEYVFVAGELTLLQHLH